MIKNKLGRFFDIYLMAFVMLGFVTMFSFVVASYKAHEPFIDKTLLFVFFLTVFTASFFLCKSQMRMSLALSHLTVFVCLFFFNAILEIPLINKLNGGKFAAWRAGVKWDARNKKEVIEDYAKDGIAMYPPPYLSRAFFTDEFNFENQVFPLSGIANVKTVLCNESGSWVTYASDRYGFNNDDAVYDQQQDSVVFVGDSFAQGYCVNPGDDVAGNLRKRGYKAISLGKAGNSLLADLAALKEYGPYLKPKVVFLMYFEGNDFLDLQYEYNFQPLRNYLNGDHSQNLVLKQDSVNKFWVDILSKIKDEFAYKLDSVEVKKGINAGVIRRLIFLSNVRKLLGFSRSSNILENGLDEKSAEELETMFRTVIKATKAQAERLNCKLYFVYLPSYETLFNRKYSLLPSSQTVRKVISELNIPLIDFYERLRNSDDPAQYFPYRKSAHYNAQGYNLLANVLESEALETK